MIKALLILFSWLTFLPTFSQKQNQEWHPYQKSEKIDTADFNVKNYKEISDSVLNSPFGFVSICSFRIFINGENQSQVTKDSRMDFYPALCESYFVKDTLHLNTGIGFFAGIGVTLKIKDDLFIATARISTDDPKVLSETATDGKYVDNIELKPKRQSLKLSDKPVKGELILGMFDAQYEPYFEKSGPKTKTNNIRIQIVFRIKPELVLP